MDGLETPEAPYFIVGGHGSKNIRYLMSFQKYIRVSLKNIFISEGFVEYFS